MKLYLKQLFVLMIIAYAIHGVYQACQALPAFIHRHSPLVPKVFPAEYEYNSLHKAAENGGVEDVGEYLRTHEINSCDDKGNTALHRATARGALDIVKLLIRKGANPNLHNIADSTPLHYAIENHKDEIVDVLLAYKSTDIEDPQWGDTPLHVAVKSNSPTILKKLLKAGAKVNALNKEGLTPLIVAAGMGNVDILKLLTDNGGDWSAKDNSGRFAANILMDESFYDTVKQLIQYFKSTGKTKSLDLVVSQGYPDGNLLHLSSKLGIDNVVKELLEAGVEINERNSVGNTALFFASTEGVWNFWFF